MTAPEQSDLAGSSTTAPTCRTCGRVAQRPFLVINGRGDKLLEGSNTLGELAKELLSRNDVSNTDRMGLAGANLNMPGEVRA